MPMKGSFSKFSTKENGIKSWPAYFLLILAALFSRLSPLTAAESGIEYVIAGENIFIIEGSNLVTCQKSNPSIRTTRGNSEQHLVRCKTVLQELPEQSALCSGTEPYLVYVKNESVKIINLNTLEGFTYTSSLGLNSTTVSCGIRNNKLNIFIGNFNGQINWLHSDLSELSTKYSQGSNVKKLDRDEQIKHQPKSNAQESPSHLQNFMEQTLSQTERTRLESFLPVSMRLNILQTGDSEIKLIKPLDSGNLLVCGRQGASIFSIDNIRTAPGAEMVEIITRVPRRRINLPSLNNNPRSDRVKVCGFNHGILCVASDHIDAGALNNSPGVSVKPTGTYIQCVKLAGQRVIFSQPVDKEVLALMPTDYGIFYKARDGIYDAKTSSRVSVSVEEFLKSKVVREMHIQ